MPPREVFFLNTWSAKADHAVETHISEIIIDIATARSRHEQNYHNLIEHCKHNAHIVDATSTPFKYRVKLKDLIFEEKILSFDLPDDMAIQGATTKAFILKQRTWQIPSDGTPRSRLGLTFHHSWPDIFVAVAVEA
jgi:hypothetical protein